jgi:hypothetical protein
MNAEVTKTITAQNMFTDWLLAICDSTTGGNYSLIIKGTFTANVVVQWAKLVNGVITMVDDSVEVFTTPTRKIGRVAENIYVRCGVPTGGFTIGTVEVRIGQKQ